MKQTEPESGIPDWVCRVGESKIEWTERTWNPVRGCSRISPGCLKCYAERDMARKNENPKVPGCHGFAIFNERREPHWTGKVDLQPHMLDIPLRRRIPTTYFVNSMSDLFHENLSFEAIDRVFAVMALCPQHTFQVLTKRADRMREYFKDQNYRSEVVGIYAELLSGTDRWITGADIEPITGCGDDMLPRWPVPLPNVWLGVSVEDQQRADERISLLLQTPAAVRFLSVEPLLGPVDLDTEYATGCHALGCGGSCDCAPKIDWVIVGGESGPGARPISPGWVRSIRDQCVAAGVAFFFKQWGGVAKRAAGRSLDGREWNEMPKAVAHV